MKKIPGLLIAGISSHSGKTTTAIALISALAQRGYQVLPAKCGPDYIDAAWLARTAGKPCANLDLWMCGRGAPQKLRSILNMAREGDGNFAYVVEGAMGLYDGHADGRGSCAEIAALLQLPILLLLNTRGLGQSCAAMACGYIDYRAPWMKKNGCPKFCGVVCTHTGSQKHRKILEKALTPVLAERNVALLGFLDTARAPDLPSRHLGLLQAAEFSSCLDFHAMGQWFSDNCDLERLLRLCDLGRADSRMVPRHAVSSPGCKAASFYPPPVKKGSCRLTVAIAHDEAFAFCYADLPHFLTWLGAHIKFFSPLRDEQPPRCDAIYLPGGYPELFAERLSANVSMRASLRNLAFCHVPIYGECGGYMYLMRHIGTVDGRQWPMCGLLDLECVMERKLVSLGYRRMRLAEMDYYMDAHTGRGEMRGHEFHYGRELSTGKNPPQPLWQIIDDGKVRPAGFRDGNVWGSWIHLYPRGSGGFWRLWLMLAGRQQACREDMRDDCI